jgi:hypothetical protein
VGFYDDGCPSIILLPPPAVASDASITVPDSQMWRLIACSFTLTVNTTAGTRTPVLQVYNAAGKTILNAVSGYGMPAAASSTQATRFCYSYGLSGWNEAGLNYASGALGPIEMESGQKITVHIDNIQAADQLSDILLQVSQVPVFVPDSPPGE